MNKAAVMAGEETSNIGASLIQTNLYIVIGLGVGVFLGLPAYFFDFIDDYKLQLNLKGLYAVAVSLFIMIAGEYTVLANSTLLACMSFGYTCFQFWGNHKPAK